MSIPVCAATLEARRERAVQRAITRACQRPSDARLAMIDRIQGLPEAYFEIASDAVRSAPQDYRIDGVHTSRWAEAVELLRDRYGLTGLEAERTLDGARDGGPWGSS